MKKKIWMNDHLWFVLEKQTVNFLFEIDLLKGF